MGKARGKRNQSQARPETGCNFSWKPNRGSQASFANAIKHGNGDVLGLGVAGGGKSYVAVNSAMDAFEDGVIDRIILSRPASGPAKTLGFTKGSGVDKVTPWITPMLHIMYERYGWRNKGIVDGMVERGEIQMLAFEHIMGMDIKDAYYICDECQGINIPTMKSLVTRVNETGKLILIGDVKQEILKSNQGVHWLLNKMEKFDGFGFTHIEFTFEDCVRSGRVKQRLLDMAEEGEY